MHVPVCVHVYSCTHVPQHMYGSQGQLSGVDCHLQLYEFPGMDRTWVIRFGSKHLYILSHLIDSSFDFISSLFYVSFRICLSMFGF